MTVLVVGAGTMGRWLGATLAAPIAFADADPDAAAAAADGIDGARTAPLEPSDSDADDGEYEAVCVAVPMTVAPDVIAAQAPRARDAILDVAGEMADTVAAMRTHAPDRERLSLHPLFAPENAPGTIAAVHDATGPVTDAVRESLAAAGNDVFDTTIEEHDESMESVQAATHAAILAWRLAATDVRQEFHTPLSRELADLADHVTGQEPRVYADIATRYDAGRDALATAAADLADADHDRFIELFENAREAATETDRTQ